MESHGKIQQNLVIAIIPARFASTRLPGKMLCDIGGKPLILHTLEQTAKAATVSRVIVATDDQRIFDVVTASGGEAALTSADHLSGTDRLAEVVETLPANSIIVNVQGDEPTISPRTIDAAVEALVNDEHADVATTCEKFETVDELMSENNVKVVTGDDGYALYFSRSPMPFPRDASLKHGGLDRALSEAPELLSLYRKHTGLYVYRRKYLLKFASMPRTRLEKIELLEQLRALENGAKIRVVEVNDHSIGGDTIEDLEIARAIVGG